jgi:hypothetical protein
MLLSELQGKQATYDTLKTCNYSFENNFGRHVFIIFLLIIIVSRNELENLCFNLSFKSI